MSGFTSQKAWGMQYLIAVLDRAGLQQYLSVGEVDSLTDQDLSDIATIMQEELNEMGFWEQLAFVARLKLAEKQGANYAVLSGD